LFILTASISRITSCVMFSIAANLALYLQINEQRQVGNIIENCKKKELESLE
jgi:hypothetical protein